VEFNSRNEPDLREGLFFCGIMANMKKTFTKTVLDNGLRIITVPMTNNQTTTVMVLVEAGSNYENAQNNGVSHFLEHMCFKGTASRPSSAIINYELDALGSASNAFTGSELTGYWAKAHHAKTDELIDVISDIFLNSTLPPKEMEKEKGVIIEEINMYEDDPRSKAAEMIDQVMYPGQAAGRPIAGPRENIVKMVRQDFVDYKQKHYTAGATTVMVAGKIDEQKVIDKVSQLFKDAPSGDPAKMPETKVDQTTPGVKVLEKDTDQTHLVLGFHAYNRYDAKVAPLKVLSTILGVGMSSRLFQKMREELGICYYARSALDLSRGYGSIALAAGVTNDRLEEAIEGIVSELKKLASELVSEKELQKAKDHRVGNMFMHLESSNNLGEFYAAQELYHDEKIKTPDERAREIQAVTAEQVRSVAREIFKTNNMNLAVVGPKQDEATLLKLLSL